jgi:hypothetical protein
MAPFDYEVDDTVVVSLAELIDSDPDQIDQLLDELTRDSIDPRIAHCNVGPLSSQATWQLVNCDIGAQTVTLRVRGVRHVEE